MRLAIATLLAAVLGAAPLADQAPAVTAAPAKAETKNLMKRALTEEFTPDREVLLDVVRIPPNTAIQRHWHPGEEFHYYLEGEVEIRIDGQETIVGKPGTVGHVPFRKLHTAVAGKQGATILVFRVHKKGEPTVYPEKEPAAKP